MHCTLRYKVGNPSVFLCGFLGPSMALSAEQGTHKTGPISVALPLQSCPRVSVKSQDEHCSVQPSALSVALGVQYLKHRSNHLRSAHSPDMPSPAHAIQSALHSQSHHPLVTRPAWQCPTWPTCCTVPCPRCAAPEAQIKPAAQGPFFCRALSCPCYLHCTVLSKPTFHRSTWAQLPTSSCCCQGCARRPAAQSPPGAVSPAPLGCCLQSTASS